MDPACAVFATEPAADRFDANVPLSAEFFIEEMQTMNVTLTPIISLIAGILILVMPRLLSMIVAIYLIAVGVIGILGMTDLRF